MAATKSKSDIKPSTPKAAPKKAAPAAAKKPVTAKAPAKKAVAAKKPAAAKTLRRYVNQLVLPVAQGIDA